MAPRDIGRDEIVFEEADPTSDIATHCMDAYADELRQRLGRGFDLDHAGVPDLSHMRRPKGVFIVARLEEMPIGCVGVKGMGGTLAEIKRMWIAPPARGIGLARQLMETAETAARGMGVEMLRLDSNSALFEALQLYRSMGWTDTAPFNDDPYPDVFLEKRISLGSRH